MRESVPLILKIETAQAFHHLPELLLEAMRSPIVGVMIARGDLAVEGGYPRLAEVQEEILWLCEAAHLPVIWATEVLDKLARTGRPSRAEVTDAAMAQQAECIMLNKGPYVDMAIAMLDDILIRMAGHQRKKVPHPTPATQLDVSPTGDPPERRRISVGGEAFGGEPSRCDRWGVREGSTRGAAATRPAPIDARTASTASGLTEIDVMPRRTRCSANSGRLDGAWPHSDEVIPAVGSRG